MGDHLFCSPLDRDERGGAGASLRSASLRSASLRSAPLRSARPNSTVTNGGGALRFAPRIAHRASRVAHRASRIARRASSPACAQALATSPTGLHGFVVAEVRDIDNEPLVQLVGGTTIETMVSHDVLGRLMVMSARQPGLAKVRAQSFDDCGSTNTKRRRPSRHGAQFDDDGRFDPSKRRAPSRQGVARPARRVRSKRWITRQGAARPARRVAPRALGTRATRRDARLPPSPSPAAAANAPTHTTRPPHRRHSSPTETETASLSMGGWRGAQPVPSSSPTTPESSHRLNTPPTTTTSTKPRRAEVYTGIFGFDGNEFYMKEWAELVGVPFGKLIERFADAIPIGVMLATGQVRRARARARARASERAAAVGPRRHTQPAQSRRRRDDQVVVWSVRARRDQSDGSTRWHFIPLGPTRARSWLSWLC